MRPPGLALAALLALCLTSPVLANWGTNARYATMGNPLRSEDARLAKQLQVNLVIFPCRTAATATASGVSSSAGASLSVSTENGVQSTTAVTLAQVR